MKTNFKLKVIGALFILLASLFTTGVYANGGDGDRGRNSGNSESEDNNQRKGRGPGGSKLFKQKDEDRIIRIINNISLQNRKNFIQRIIDRLNILETNISSSNMNAEVKSTRLTLIAEIRDLLTEKLQEITPDTVSPIVSSLTSSSLNNSGATFSVTVNEAGKGYFVVLGSGSASPTGVQVKDMKDSGGNLANIKGSLNLSTGTNSFTVSGLTAGTNYVLYFVAQDSSGNLSTVSSQIFTTTSSTSDTTAPIFSITLSGTTSSGATLIVNTNESGTGYFVALPNGSLVPSSSQVKAGTDGLGTTAVIKSSISLTGGLNTLNVTGLNNLTTYVLFFTAQDVSLNLSSLPLSFSFTTQ